MNFIYILKTEINIKIIYIKKYNILGLDWLSNMNQIRQFGGEKKSNRIRLNSIFYSLQFFQLDIRLFDFEHIKCRFQKIK